MLQIWKITPRTAYFPDLMIKLNLNLRPTVIIKIAQTVMLSNNEFSCFLINASLTKKSPISLKNKIFKTMLFLFFITNNRIKADSSQKKKRAQISFIIK